MKKIGILVIIGLIIVNIFISYVYASKSKSNTFLAEQFFVYYGVPSPSVILNLQKYEVVFIEPRNFTTKQIAEVKQSGTLVYAYTSFVEQNVNNKEFGELKDQWFYQPDNIKMKSLKFNSYYMDMDKKGYQNFLIKQVVYQVISKKCDGLFVDTVGDLDDLDWNKSDVQDMREAYIDILSRLKNTYPNLKIIQNWGFDTLKNYSSSYVDGIMWENFSFENLKNDQWSKNRFSEVNDLKLDLYIVTPDDFEKNKSVKFNKKMYFFLWDNDIYK